MNQSPRLNSVGFYFSSELSFLTINGVGRHYIDSHKYDWDNRGRRDKLCLVQYCVDGEGALEVDGIQHIIHPGEAFIVNIPGNNRYFLPSHSPFWDVLFFEFSKECLPLMRKIYQSTGPIVSISRESGLEEQMFHIYERSLNNELETFFENTKMAYNFWMDLTAYALSSSDSNQSKIDYAKVYIDQNYFKPNLSLDLIAEHIGVSKYYMSKEFHKKFGLSPGKYLKELRISQSCRLLAMHSDYTIQEIAGMVGYANDSYFGKVFKAVKGTTPNQFRKQANQCDFVRVLYETPNQL